jgi:hypothetical protein
MAEISGPWDGVGIGDALALAPYSSYEWATIWRDILHASKINSGVLFGSGVAPDQGLRVVESTPAAASVDITPGAAVVHGRWYQIQGAVNVTKTIAANGSGNPRIDRIVLRSDETAQTIRLAVLQGTPAVTPTPPAVTQVAGGTWEISLAQIAVANGFATLTQANIQPEAEPAGEAGNVYLNDVLNRSAGDFDTGDVVIADTSVDGRNATSTTAPSVPVLGVWVGHTPSGSYGRVLVDGIGYVRTNAAVSRGGKLMQSTIAKRAIAAGVSEENTFATVLEAAGSGGLVLCRVHASIEQLKYCTALTYVPVGTYQDNSGNWVDVDATNVKISGVTNTGRIRLTFHFTGLIVNGNTGLFRIYNQTSAQGYGDATYGLAATRTNSFEHITTEWIATALTPGTTYEFRLQFKSQLGTDMVQIVNEPIVMLAQEV